MTESASPARPTRPGYLVIALIVSWFLGLRTVHEGFVTVSIVLDPFAGDTLELPLGLRDALVGGLNENSAWALPVGLAQILLGGLLVATNAATLFAGRSSTSFNLQVLAGNAALAIVGYAASAPVRSLLVDALVKSPELQPQTGNLPPTSDLIGAYYWGFRLVLMFHVVALGLVAFALTRPATKRFLTHSQDHPGKT